MELLDPAFLEVHDGEFVEHRGFELQRLRGVRLSPAPDLREDRLDLRVGVVLGAGRLEAVVGEPAADGVEEIVPPAERVEVRREVLDVHVGRGGQPVHPRVERLRRFDGHALVGPPRRQHADAERRVGGDGPVVFEAVGRVVRGADDLHVHPAQNAAAGELRPRQLRVAFLPDALRRPRIQQAVADAEDAPELQVRPVIERVAQRLRDRLRPLLELLPVRRPRRCRSVRPRRTRASRATCNGRRRARFPPGF